MGEYREFAKQFNPIKYDLGPWVRLAKEAGMRYILITANRHEGFVLYDSKAADSKWATTSKTPEAGPIDYYDQHGTIQPVQI